MGNALEQPGAETGPSAPAAATVPRQATKPRDAARPKRQPPYAVILHNDPINTIGFVVTVIRKVFRYGGGKAFWLTLRAHVGGRSIVWTGSLEVAELKAQQVRACGPDPSMLDHGARPLKTTIEPLPG